MPYPTFLPTVPDNLSTPIFGPATLSPVGVRFLFGIDSLGNLCVFRSSDFGATWSRADPLVVKTPGEPSSTACVKDANFPAVPKVYLVWASGPFPGPYTYTLSTFNLATELWEADIPSALAQDAFISTSTYLVHRAVDNKAILWTNPNQELVAGNPYYRAQIAFCDLAAVAWSAYTQVGTPGGDDSDYYPLGCVSGVGGLTHLFLIQDNTPLAAITRTKNLIHVSLTAANLPSVNQVVQAFNNDDTFVTTMGGIAPQGLLPISRVVGADVEVLYPYVAEINVGPFVTQEWRLNVAKGISAALPAWAINAIETRVRPFGEVTPPLYRSFCLVNDAGDVVNAFWGRLREALEDERVDTSTSADGLAWTVPSTFYTLPALSSFTPTFPPTQICVQRVGSLGMYVVYTDGLVFPVAYWDVPAVAPVALPSPDFFRRGKPEIRCANVWDWCLGNEVNLWHQVDWKRRALLRQCLAGGLTAPDGLPLDLDSPLHMLPSQGREFHKIGPIGLPVPNTDTPIFQFRVPVGYDGIVYAVLCKFVGKGFVNGSGDLLWRFRMNRHWIKSLQAIPTELGDYTAYAQLEEFIWIHGGQTIGAYGWLSPASGLVPDPSRAMIAAVQGWYFPAGLIE